MSHDTFLFFYDGGKVFGGIESLIVRIGRALQSQGARLTLICRDSTAFAACSDVSCHAVGDDFNYFMSRHRLSPFLERIGVANSVKLIVAMDSLSGLIASVASWVLGCPAVSSNWVPDYFRFVRERPYHPMAALLAYNYCRHFTSQTRFVMADAYLDQARAMFGSRIDASLSPIPLELDRFLSVNRAPQRDLLVTVARLDHMKNYLLFLPGMIRRLLNEGMSLRLHVYGDGPLKAEIERRTVAHDVADRVEFRGAISYERLPEAYREAGIFIGMGTAGLEAAAAGVPTIDAEPYDENGRSLGTIFHGDAAGARCTDRLPQWTDIATGVRTLVAMDERRYSQEGEWHRSRVRRHDMPHFIALLERAAQAEYLRRPSRVFVEILNTYATLRGVLR